MASYIVEHPLVQHKLGLLRSMKTGMAEFRAIANELAALLAYESLRNIPTENILVGGWQREKIQAVSVATGKFTLIPVLRAGLGMVDGVLRLLPDAKIGVVGLFRNEKTLEPVEYFRKLPMDMSRERALILDPMLATGGTLLATIAMLKQCGCQKITSLNIVCSPEGLEKAEKAHPDVDIYTAAIDERLNDRGYILPGLGDAGDRIFGTE